MSDLIIRGFSQSSYVMTARIAAAEKGVEYTFEPVAPGDEKLATYHPYKKVPSLEHGDVKLYESQAIVRYIDEAFDGPALQPEGAADRALMEQWISVVHCYLYPHAVPRYILQYIFPKGPDGKPARDTIDAAVKDLDHDLGVLDAAYGDSEWLVGGALSAADIFVVPLYAGISSFPEGKELIGKYAKVGRALGAMAQRPSFGASMPPQG